MGHEKFEDGNTEEGCDRSGWEVTPDGELEQEADSKAKAWETRGGGGGGTNP